MRLINCEIRNLLLLIICSCCSSVQGTRSPEDRSCVSPKPDTLLVRDSVFMGEIAELIAIEYPKIFQKDSNDQKLHAVVSDEVINDFYRFRFELMKDSSVAKRFGKNLGDSLERFDKLHQRIKPIVLPPHGHVQGAWGCCILQLFISESFWGYYTVEAAQAQRELTFTEFDHERAWLGITTYLVRKNDDPNSRNRYSVVASLPCFQH